MSPRQVLLGKRDRVGVRTMPREPVRFIHAARLMLDHQLRGLAELPEEWHETVRDATLIAFDRLIDACLERDVDFLLLTGDNFDARDRSLRAQSTLARGLNRLAEHGIPTYLCAGTLDPWSAWFPQIRLPSAVHVLGQSDGEQELAVQKDSRTLATIRWMSQAELAVKTPPSEDALDHSLTADSRPLSVGVSYLDSTNTPPFAGANVAAEWSFGAAMRRFDFDYLALGCSVDLKTADSSGVAAHNPGPAQGTSAADSGICGATLVEVPADGPPRLTRIPTAPVRWDRLHVHVNESMSTAEVLELFSAAIRQLEQSPVEKLRLLTWNIHGSGSLPPFLAASESRRQAFAAFDRELSGSGPGIQTVATHIRGPSAGKPPSENDSQLDHDFRQRLDARLSNSDWSPSGSLAESVLHGGPWQSAMESVVAALDPEDVTWESRRLADKWFAATEELPA